MESWKKSAIWKVIHYIDMQEIKNAKPYCQKAEMELKSIEKRINLDQNRKLTALTLFIGSVRRNCREEINAKIQSAHNIFDNCIKPFLMEEERSKQKKVQGSQASPRNGVNVQVAQTKSKTEISKATHKRESAELALAFQNIYTSGFWEAAFQGLNRMTKSEPLSIECLLKIVQDAFAANGKEAKLQLQLAEECALLIVKNGELPNVKPKLSPNARVNDFLQRYRYEHADLATGRLQKEMLELIQDRFVKTYNIRIHESSSVEQFIRVCTEVTWLMCVEDPPVTVVHNQGSPKLDKVMYDLIPGKMTNCVVWPALQCHGSSALLAKGVAWCK